ncbi:MAG: TetR/AcrR family transcriptional regulator [Lachnospiraceae bacterium]|nr:TetR/AcrR family transcriptional regulator [Lachnospiraceae bacterium]
MEEDKKQKHSTMTRECIFTALLLLMEKTPYGEITITDIAKKAGVSRMSYYRLYKSKDDILIQYFNDAFADCLRQIREAEGLDRYQFALIIFRAGAQHYQVLEAVARAKLYDMILERFVGYCAYLAEHVFGLDTKDVRVDYWIYQEAGSVCLLLLRWIMRGRRETPEEMAGFFTDEPLAEQQMAAWGHEKTQPRE